MGERVDSYSAASNDERSSGDAHGSSLHDVHGSWEQHPSDQTVASVGDAGSDAGYVATLQTQCLRALLAVAGHPSPTDWYLDWVAG